MSQHCHAQEGLRRDAQLLNKLDESVEILALYCAWRMGRNERITLIISLSTLALIIPL